jgi:hypothetical protein
MNFKMRLYRGLLRLTLLNSLIGFGIHLHQSSLRSTANKSFFHTNYKHTQESRKTHAKMDVQETRKTVKIYALALILVERVAYDENQQYV